MCRMGRRKRRFSGRESEAWRQTRAVVCDEVSYLVALVTSATDIPSYTARVEELRHALAFVEVLLQED